jgi:ribosome-binding factor A
VSRRLERVEELLRRELSEVILHGGLRDPRLRPTSAICVTGVSVSADLGNAHVFIDVLAEDRDVEKVLAGLSAGAAVIRARLADRVHLKRVPHLTFARDESIARAARIEEILSEVRPDRDDPADQEDDPE